MIKKSVKDILMPALVLVVLLALANQPARATPPQDLPLEFDVDLIFRIGNFTGTGSWQELTGLQASGYASQEATHAGYTENGWFLRTAHSTATLCSNGGANCADAEDTITIRSQILDIDLVPFGPFSGDGMWVITGASGIYEGLHGNGAAELSANFYYPCPDPSVIGPCIVAHMDFDGYGHFEP